MSKSASINAMQQAIRSYIRRNLPKDENQSQIGTIRGNSVIIGNKKYRCDMVNDMWLDDGDQVCCLTPKGNVAVVVGKL